MSVRSPHTISSVTALALAVLVAGAAPARAQTKATRLPLIAPNRRIASTASSDAPFGESLQVSTDGLHWGPNATITGVRCPDQAQMGCSQTRFTKLYFRWSRNFPDVQNGPENL